MPGKKTKCNYQILEICCKKIGEIVANLQNAYEMAGNLLSSFDEAYEGDARGEVDMFLTSLPMHIYRLELFYSKLMMFVWMTALSFESNDAEMTQNMER